MQEKWILFTTEAGLNTIENSTLEKQSFNRMQIFLKSFFKDRMQKQEVKHKSFLFQIVKSMKKGSNKLDLLDGEAFVFQIDGQSLKMLWDEHDGLVIMAMKKGANALVRELSKELQKDDFWI